ncbi:MAG: tRNA (adenosine(37)-N6)-threonylcarbamoyltransferase complex dimerization subunit type 1 TsaB [Anaerohalosphaeraceae bacterium]|nr:tRNA (adenosine(37)-N6)-threonylcarbamoyltransferase complex dimerization subunit type 1 TsaB [Anaerohalosphaeraceae bacterium]
MQNKAVTKNITAIALETSGRLGSVAIGQGGILSDQKSFSAPMRHSAELFDCLVELLSKIEKKPSQIDHIYISVGPGSFTGIRISVACAKAMALACDAKIVAVSTAAALAENVEDESIKRIGTIIDAKRGQFFTAVFEKKNSLWQKIVNDSLTTAEQFKQSIDAEPISLIGEGLVYYADKFATDKIKVLDEKYWHSRAANIFKLGSQMALENKFTSPELLLPFYMRKTQAEKNWEKKNKAV